MDYAYDYYRISIPGDLADSLTELAEHAINEARERARLYCIPCDWEARRVSGEVGDHEVRFVVRRRRRRSA